MVPAGLGTAIAGASATKDQPLRPEENLHSSEALVAHVTNAAHGEISLFVGEREVKINDRTIAARLVRAARK